MIVGSFKIYNESPPEAFNDQIFFEMVEKELRDFPQTEHLEASVQSPAPHNATAPIRNSGVRNTREDEQLKLSKDKLWNLILETKKIINNTSRSDHDLDSMKKTLENIKERLTGMKIVKTEEIDNFQNIVEKMKQSIM